MIVLQIVYLGMLLLVIPMVAGSIFANVDKTGNKFAFRWIAGQIVLWAGFQFMCVPMILTDREVWEVSEYFVKYNLLLVLLAAGLFVWRRRKKPLHVVEKQKYSRSWYLAWAGFWILLIFQLVQAILMTYGDGDDAFYVAEATHAVVSDDMYKKIPYTGWPTILDVRHGMAPFPIWIAVLSKLSGIRTVSLAHILLPMTLISMTYAIYYLLGSKFFAKRQECIPVFMIFTEILVLFGDYSFYTVENFMIARSRQGKAALGSIVIPMLILMLLILLERLQESKKPGFGYWILLAAVLTSACLCSTLGALLVCMLVGVTGLCGAVCYRKWLVLIPMALCCLPCVVYAAMYLLLA